MADMGAVYGAVGAVGGALIGAGAAVLGPLLVQRGSSREQKEAEARRRAGEEVERIIQIRSTGRAWQDTLERTVQDLEAGRPVDIERFDETISSLEREAASAAYAAAVDGVWVGLGPAEEGYSPGLVLELLAAGTGQVRATILRLGGGDVGSDERREICTELAHAVTSARAARAQLNARLVKRIERILGQSIRRL
ncbi:hypothetical protein [Streptomyces sp. MK7]|uniref:hypothetical protein n=1 Tax=Streptomyces sp. MK7 TaxID=3067635 RepID=UPI00292D8352|nr:hypothetical protein [Streptomyces sp. MK7]